MCNDKDRKSTFYVAPLEKLNFTKEHLKVIFLVKELGCFHIIFAQILTAHNFCLTRITASILIYANALGYFLSI